MRRLLCLTTLALLACGGPTGPEPEPTGTPSLSVVAGDSQSVAVNDTLPFDAEVCAERGGEPVTDQLMDWRVLEGQAGEPFVTTTRTDSSGCTRNRVIAGTRAHTHPDINGSAHMEVRWIDQNSGEAIVEETISYIVEPGVPDQLRPLSRLRDSLPLYEIGDSLDVMDGLHPMPARDQYGNPVPGEKLRPLAVSWTYLSPFVQLEGTTGSSWNAGPVPELHRERWYTGDVFTIDTTAANPNYPPDTLEVWGQIGVDVDGVPNNGQWDGTIAAQVRLPACYEHRGPTGDEEAEVENVPWTEDCPKPWESW